MKLKERKNIESTAVLVSVENEWFYCVNIFYLDAETWIDLAKRVIHSSR